MFTDENLNLDTLLIQVRNQLTPKWYQFGVAAGIPTDILSKCSNYPPEECIVEVLDYWLRKSGQSRKKWSDVASILKQIDLQQLANEILKLYDTI